MLEYYHPLSIKDGEDTISENESIVKWLKKGKVSNKYRQHFIIYIVLFYLIYYVWNPVNEIHKTFLNIMALHYHMANTDIIKEK